MPKICSALEALSLLKSHQRVFIQGAAMTPNVLIEAMLHQDVENVEVVHIHTEGDAPYTQPAYQNKFKTKAFFTGANLRKAIAEGRADYVPVFLSEIPLLFSQGILPIDVALIQVSPPDKHGYCTMGTSVDVALSAVQNAKAVVAQVNPQVPRAHGDGLIKWESLTAVVECDVPLHESKPSVIDDVTKKIGQNVASLVEDGATLQMGIGAIPDAVLNELHSHKRLGIHTEMFSDGIIPLVEKGIITNEEKVISRGKIISCFAVGTRKLYDFIDDNPFVRMRGADYTNDTALIRRNPKATAINSAIEVDLVGQVCADTIGTMQFSGVGGQMDFIRGAALSHRGKAIIALASQTKGISKIVPFLKNGASVTTTRSHVRFVVTENGIADLFGKSLTERAKALISIAHPEHREELTKAAEERFMGF
jgi:acyl-CoA hydrolase